jgi:phytoene dehydrogenase-like protein
VHTAEPLTGSGDRGLDAVVVGAGPNGLAAAITLARAGRSVLVLEAAANPGGGCRTAELTLPGFRHDVCAAVHPLALASPFFRQHAEPLATHGLTLLQPLAPLAHPLDDSSAAVLERSVEATGGTLGEDGAAWQRLLGPLANRGAELAASLLDPLRVPRHPLLLARFGRDAVRSAERLASASFRGPLARGLLAGLAGHTMLPLSRRPTAGFALLLAALGHAVGWPVVRGGSQGLTDALVAYLRGLGGEVRCGHEVRSLAQLPPARAVLLDVTPRQLLRIAGDRLPSGYRRRLARYRYGPGVVKVDWALDGPVPWKASGCDQAGTVHLGGTLDEIAAAEAAVNDGTHPEHPFVLFAQPSRFDPTRAPAGRHTAWAYCHVPHGSTVEPAITADRVQAQVERFAPGFGDRILARAVRGPADLERDNANYVGGDINGGVQDLRQLFTRPVARLTPWLTPLDGVYLCSSSTPPGGGVHGMCGYLAARAALRRSLA